MILSVLCLPPCRPEKLKLQSDHLLPLLVPAGSDKFKDIGRPKGGAPVSSSAAVAEAIVEWKELFDRSFPAGRTARLSKIKFEIPDQYKEEGEGTAGYFRLVLKGRTLHRKPVLMKQYLYSTITMQGICTLIKV
jgi:hypothetical protein